MGNAVFFVGQDQRFIQNLIFLCRHGRNQQGKEHMQALYFKGKLRCFPSDSIDHMVCRIIFFPDLHDINAGAPTWGKFDIGAIHIVAEPFILMSFIRSDDKRLDLLLPEPFGKKLNRIRLSGSAGSHDRNIGILITGGIKKVSHA